MIRKFRGIEWLGVGLLFLPWILSCAFAGSAEVSWWVAWTGSIAIFAWVWSGKAGGIDTSVPWRLRIMHPLFLVHGIFAGYGFVTAIFYWLDLNGIAPAGLAGNSFGRLETAAEAQRFYVLAHASLALGLVIASRPGHCQKRRFRWQGSHASLLLVISALATLAGLVFEQIPGMGQLAIVFSRLGLVAGAASLGPSLAPSGQQWLPVSVAINGALLLFAAASGWKEEVLVLLILLGLATFPLFPKLSVTVGSLLFAASLIVLPVLSNAIRQSSWDEGMSKKEALLTGVKTLTTSSTQDLTASSWSFATGRLSEAAMFMTYIESVNRGTPREGLAILRQALLAPVPRILWAGKPDLEKQVMQRAYHHGVISEMSVVSAKPHPVVDAYLMGGHAGIFLTFLGLGALGSWAFSYCQSHFGGVFLGGVFFNGLFSILWRGNCFEFMFGTLFWAVSVTFGLNWLLQNLGWTYVETRPKRPQSKSRLRLRRKRDETSEDSLPLS